MLNFRFSIIDDLYIGQQTANLFS